MKHLSPIDLGNARLDIASRVFLEFVAAGINSRDMSALGLEALTVVADGSVSAADILLAALAKDKP